MGVSKFKKREIAEVVLVGGSTLIQKYKSSWKLGAQPGAEGEAEEQEPEDTGLYI